MSQKQREQAIERLHAGQAARMIANDFNSIWKIDLQVRRNQHDIPSERISDPSVMIQYVVGWDLTTSDVVVPTEFLSLHKDTVRHVSNGPYTGKTGEIDNGGM